MKIELGRGELCLAENHPIRLRHARGVHIECTAGTLWITVPGQRDDIFLNPGQDFRIPNQSTVLVEAIGDARVRLGAGIEITAQQP